jgi:hypothetical protein
MKWINALEKIKTPDPKTTEKDDLDVFLWDAKKGTDKTDRIPTDEMEFKMDERRAIVDVDGCGDRELIEKVIGIFQGKLIPQNG